MEKIINLMKEYFSLQRLLPVDLGEEFLMGWWRISTLPFPFSLIFIPPYQIIENSFYFDFFNLSFPSVSPLLNQTYAHVITKYR